MLQLLNKYIDTYRGLSSSSWMLALVMFINRTGTMVLPFLGIYMKNELHFSTTEIGIVMSCFGLGSLVGNILGGWLNDRYSSFAIQLFSLIITGPMYFILAGLKDVSSLAIGMFCITAMADIFRPANSAAVTAFATTQNLTRAFSLNRMAINLGFSFGPFLGGILASISYDFLFYGNGIGCMVAAVVFFFYFRDKKAITISKRKEVAEQKSAANSSNSAYADGAFVVFTLLCVLYFIPFCQILNHIPLFFEGKGGLNEFQIGIIMGYSSLIIVVIEMAMVHAMERRFKIFTNIIFGVALAIPCFLSFYFSSAVWALYFGITMLSLSEILFMPFYSTVAALRSKPHNKGAYMALNSLSFSIAFIITPTLAGQIIDKYSYNTLFLFNICLCFITLIGFQNLRKLMKNEDRLLHSEQ